jgi:hypothetical protein
MDIANNSEAYNLSVRLRGVEPRQVDDILWSRWSMKRPYILKGTEFYALSGVGCALDLGLRLIRNKGNTKLEERI